MPYIEIGEVVDHQITVPSVETPADCIIPEHMVEPIENVQPIVEESNTTNSTNICHKHNS